MTPEKYAIVALLSLQATTLLILWRTNAERHWFRMAWIRESRELLTFKKGQD
jgi:hypothetical protein